jgi:hypothetical protein
MEEIMLNFRGWIWTNIFELLLKEAYSWNIMTSSIDRILRAALFYARLSLVARRLVRVDRVCSRADDSCVLILSSDRGGSTLVCDKFASTRTVRSKEHELQTLLKYRHFKRSSLALLHSVPFRGTTQRQ